MAKSNEVIKVAQIPELAKHNINPHPVIIMCFTGHGCGVLFSFLLPAKSTSL